MPRLAIIGSGIAGLGCAHFLHHRFDLTVFEQNAYVGGHTNTVDVEERLTGAASQPTSRQVSMDTGFMVYNEVTYPQLTRLFKELDVPTKATDMSFSVKHTSRDLEFCGSSLNHLFAQRSNLLSPRFIRMLLAINRFNQEAVVAMDDPAVAQLTLGEYVKLRGYGTDFFDLYLVPMSSAVWSTPPDLMLSFPAATLLRFFHNHGFLGLHTQHPWRTVAGGSREYVKRITRPWRERILLEHPAAAVARQGKTVTVTTTTGKRLEFDGVIIATHGDEALRLLADPTPEERRVLGAFRYQKNVATVHTDIAVMPKRRLAWSSWNYEIVQTRGGGISTATHYWMNRLQGVSDRENYFVSIERPDAIDPARVIRRINYTHPLFDLAAIRAQPELPGLNRRAQGTTQTFFAGSYFRYGFHEDAFLSAVRLAEQLLGGDPWAVSGTAPADRKTSLASLV